MSWNRAAQHTPASAVLHGSSHQVAAAVDINHCLRSASGHIGAMRDAPPADERPSGTCEFVQELRLAVVMYGGVSLAVYMNGVAQELLRLVRAGAPAARPVQGAVPTRVAEADLRGSERAYRRLARIAGGDGDWRALAADPAAPLRTRVVVDILSGTSAGGINAVFLAKALANDQDIDRLRGLWLRKGDLDRLLVRARRPESLLDGAQMLGDLLEAFDAMDADRAPSARSPYVDELDLHVTATDIHGRAEVLPLGDSGASERRHRHVFRFSYAAAHAVGADANDFGWRDNPLLAFAARCTSSFPVAFPPAQLEDLGAAALAGRAPDPARLRRLFRCRSDADPVAAVGRRAFGDGGYLDNKPFSQATATLARRRADLPVVRRLVYVEPVPERLGREDDPAARPDAIENAAAALLTLPRYETIREDLAAVVERNRLIERVAALTRGIERDVAHRPTPQAQPGSKAAPDATVHAWRAQDLRDQIAEYGAPYGVYHRLKVQALLDDLALLLVRLVGVEEGGAEHDGLRRLAARWARLGFAEFHADVPPGGATENQLLLAFDLGYRLRRLESLLRVVADLHRLPAGDPQRRQTLASAGVDDAPDDAELPAFRRALLAVRFDLNEVATGLRQVRRALRDPASSPLVPLVAGLRALAPELAALGRAPAATRAAREDALWEAVGGGVGALAAALDAELKPAFERASLRIRAMLDPERRADGRWERAVRACLWHFYRYFDHFDLILFPITYGTAIGEATPVELVRIAPEDATALIDERRDPRGRRKLAGTALGNFGAFLDAGWRRNDLLWGRLDAAERLIRTALPERPEAAEALVVEAHEAILAEELLPAEGDELCRLLAQALVRIGVDPGRAGARELAALVERESGEPLGVRLEALLRRCLDAPALREHLRRAYEVDRRLEPAVAMRLAARSADVAGRMLAVLGERHRGASLVAPWLIRVGRFAWGFVELALPGRTANLLVRHWLRLLYLLELILVLGGLLAGAPAIQDFGAKALVLTGGAHLALSIGGALLARRPGRSLPLRRLAVWILAGLGLAVLALVLSGVAARLVVWLDRATGWWRG